MADIIIYTRKMCGFCTAAKSLLAKKNASFREFDGTFDSKIRQEMMSKSGRTTFPQIFIGGKHIGGCDELHELERQGKLDPMLKAS
ncbi:MAG: glutaredoxin 3 [Salaquimonas sp.]